MFVCMDYLIQYDTPKLFECMHVTVRLTLTLAYLVFLNTKFILK